ncbi:hypothetical protein LAZ67_15000032 [Cordylochernes scorpioides]|uniref:Ankyrin repeat domain-containing protein n=1 Tax=Cordylochernes scorpioides TaxID=51811 RepID=A0ABY6L7N7_9ARAC|nr:hypothetical protein LAZ67_15000032 [Cordylochernes scorpioides]
MELKINLFRAIRNGNLEEVKKLLEEGVEVNVELDSEEMSEYNHEVMEDGWRGVLIDCDTPLHLATKMKNFDMFRFLVDNGANINASNANGKTVLYNSIYYEHFEIFYNLIDLGADYNAELRCGGTLLMLASGKYNTRFMKELLKRGVDVEAKDYIGRTAIYFTLRANFENFRILYDAGADINICPKFMEPLLGEACIEQAQEVVEFLIKLGVDINQKGPHGNTPLANTSENDSKEIAKLLIMAGAIIDSRNKDEDTPCIEQLGNRMKTL